MDKSSNRLSYKYRIYPSKSQISKLENNFSMCRYLYNWSLAERKEAYENEKRNISYYDQQNKLPDLKKEKPWFKSVYSLVLQDVLRRLDKSYQSFFRRVKNGEKPGYPKFKKKGCWNSLTYSQHNEKPLNNKINVPKIGNIQVVYHREIPVNSNIKTLTISKEGCKWYACFSFEYLLECEPKQELHNPIGIDLGCDFFTYDSNGNFVKAPKFIKQLEKQLRRIQRKKSITKKRTTAFRKLLKAEQKIHYRIACQRNDFLHKQANELLAKSDVPFMEKLEISKMMKRPNKKKDGETGRYLPNGAKNKSKLHKSISDVAWGKFVSILEYKSKRLGKKIHYVNPAYTSQKCSICGQIVKKSLSTRTHKCLECGTIMPRDYNAARNILRLGLQSLGIISREAPAIIYV